jgi:hypothetical protein
MVRRVTFTQQPISILDVAAYHQDTEASLRVYFNVVSPYYFRLGYSADEILNDRLEETDKRSSFVVLTFLEAAFRIDYSRRCQLRRRDELSRAFRYLYKTKRYNVRLDDDIFATWQEIYPINKKLIGDLRGAFIFRHWLAHGRHSVLKIGCKYDYQSIYALADAVFATFPFC